VVTITRKVLDMNDAATHSDMAKWLTKRLSTGLAARSGSERGYVNIWLAWLAILAILILWSHIANDEERII